MTTAKTRPVRRRRSGRPSESTGTPAPIRTRALTKHYGDRIAVDTLDLQVRAGEIFGLLGQNGAGKTTTILMLLGLTEPTGGSARVVGLDPARRPLEVKRRVGYLPDSVGFYGSLTGRENLRYTARLNGLSGADADRHVDEALDHVGLTERADTRTDTYSRGMIQRLGIADALIKDPDILILDEPTASIDPIGVVEILELLRRLVNERGMTILLSSHLLDQVQSVCDRVGIFAHGRLIGVGTVEELESTFGDGSARLELELLDRSDPTVALRAVPGVEHVERVDRGAPPGTWRITVRPAAESVRAREAIIGLAAGKALPLTSIRELAPSLEDIYRTAVAGMTRGFAVEEVTE